MLPILAAGGSAFGGAIGGIGSAISGLFGRSSAKKSMRFQREMAQNAHQWEVADLRAAGLNPILSGTGGPGARASGGAMPQTPDFASNMIAGLRAQAEIKNITAQTKLTNTKADILGTGGEFGSDIQNLYQWLKRQGSTSAKKLQQTIDEYYQHRSTVDPAHGGQKPPSGNRTIPKKQSGIWSNRLNRMIYPKD